ncbi:hypothetical protein [Flavobacterium sp. N502540]|uniref:hypothetical protein n=1 Tax=Flavobacterium sp. N502540 TaxID=2986838 RepID=UPI00222586C7|nr:hypothetical protein [Flavobacterium sp. N502540]
MSRAYGSQSCGNLSFGRIKIRPYKIKERAYGSLLIIASENFREMANDVAIDFNSIIWKHTIPLKFKRNGTYCSNGF